MIVQIGFSTPKKFNPVSWLVRKITKSKASHAWFLYHDKDWDLDMVMEAHELGFRLVPYDHFKKKNFVVGLFTPKHDIDEGLRKVAVEYLGTVYDYKGLIGMAVVMLGRWLKRKWSNPFHGSKYVFCSEAAVIALKASKGYEDLRDEEDSIGPEDLMERFERGEL